MATSEIGIDKPTVPDHPPGEPRAAVDLHPDNIDEFLEWAGGVAVGSTEVVRARIAAARSNRVLLDRLLEQLWTLPVRDDGRHYLLLSTIGELGDERAATELARFVWEPDEHIASVTHLQEDGCNFATSVAELLKARAVEMLAYLRTDEAVEETMRVVAEHPTVSVRAAAIDAHLFNHDDDPGERERLRGRARSGDEAMVGLPRFTRDMDPRTFDRAIADLYERYPDRRARPERVSSGPARPREEA